MVGRVAGAEVGEGMNRFTQHIPTFVDYREDKTPSFEFETTEQLLAHEWVAVHKTRKGFDRFVKSDRYLMTESNDGFSWWVIGYLEDPSSVDLPQWQGWKFRVRMHDGSERVVAGDEVRSSCGNVITLRDNTVCTNLRDA